MTKSIDERIQEVEQTFEQKKAEREQHLSKAEECLVELTKLQGAWAALNELQESEKKPNKKATVIEAVPKEK